MLGFFPSFFFSFAVQQKRNHFCFTLKEVLYLLWSAIQSIIQNQTKAKTQTIQRTK